MGDDTAVLTTGGRSEEFVRSIMSLPDHCFVQMGDFSGYAIRQCQKKGLRQVCLAGFVGKMAKMATGISQTHVKGSKVDTKMLAKVAAECGADSKTAARIREANTARHVMEMVLEDGTIHGFFESICEMVRSQMSNKAPALSIRVIMFSFDGSILGEASGSGSGRTRNNT